MVVESILFWIFALLAVGSALCVVGHRSLVYNTLSLIVVFLCISAFFVLNNADFLAIAQLIVYAVGLTIILLFGIMFTGDHPMARVRAMFPSQGWLFGSVAAMVGFLLVVMAQFPFAQTSPSPQLVKIMQTQGSTLLLGLTLFQNYGLPFELASILLLVAMVGAILLARRTNDADDAPELGVRPWDKAEYVTRMPVNITSQPRAFAETGPLVAGAADKKEALLP